MRTALAVVLGVGALSLPARADVAPPEGYVEACTIANEQGPGAECAMCDTWHEERDRCAADWGAKGYKQRCKTYGASRWSEVWCKGDAKPTAKKGGCAVGGGAGSWGGAAVLALGLAPLVRRRRAPSAAGDHRPSAAAR